MHTISLLLALWSHVWQAPAKEIIICDQKNERIVIVDVTQRKVTWEWKADAPYAMIKRDAQAWFSNLSDARLVYNGQYILTAASGGGVALINIATRKADWYDFAGGNTHSAELLPDGNVVSASSTGGYLMIFSVGASVKNNYKIPLPDAHNVVWDHQRKVLYAAGENKLKVFSYNDNCKAPELVEKKTYTIPSTGAHDLFPVYGSDRELWMSNHHSVFRFNVETGNFKKEADIEDVKSISSGPEGWPVMIAIANGIGGKVWRSDRLLDMNGKIIYQDDSLGLYKARWRVVNTFSYPEGDRFHACVK